jgi:hypothetical protein
MSTQLRTPSTQLVRASRRTRPTVPSVAVDALKARGRAAAAPPNVIGGGQPAINCEVPPKFSAAPAAGSSVEGRAGSFGGGVPLFWRDGICDDAVSALPLDQATTHRRFQPTPEQSLVRELLVERRVRRNERRAEVGGGERAPNFFLPARGILCRLSVARLRAFAEVRSCFGRRPGIATPRVRGPGWPPRERETAPRGQTHLRCGGATWPTLSMVESSALSDRLAERSERELARLWFSGGGSGLPRPWAPQRHGLFGAAERRLVSARRCSPRALATAGARLARPLGLR